MQVFHGLSRVVNVTVKHANPERLCSLVDFSPQMLELSGSPLAKFKDRTAFIQADFKKDNWSAAVPAGFDLVVSLQAAHKLRHASRIPKL